MTSAPQDGVEATIAMTSDGIRYDPRADVWSLPAPGGPVRFDFLSLPGVSAALRTEAKHAMQSSLAHLPTRSVHGDFMSVRGLFRRVTALVPGAAFAEITPGLLREHDAALPAGRRHLATGLAIALRRWAEAGATGLSSDLFTWLSQEPTERHVAGRAVRSCSRTQGALSAYERDALLAALHAAYASSSLVLSDYAMALLVAVLALRPLQVACLKVADLQAPSDPVMFAADLMVSRLKQGGGQRPRDEFTARGLVPTLAAVLRVQAAAASGRAAALGVAPPDAPMFPASRPRAAAPGFAGHLSASAVGRRVGATLNGLDALNGGHVFPLRLRRTFATLLSQEGCGLAEVSILLDHTAPDGALAYIEASPALGQRLGGVTGGAFENLAARLQRPNNASEPGPHSGAAP